jgi:hypothetical protein
LFAEVDGGNPEDVLKDIEREAVHRLGLRVGIELSAQPPPRFEMKASRVIDNRVGQARSHLT